MYVHEHVHLNTNRWASQIVMVTVSYITLSPPQRTQQQLMGQLCHLSALDCSLTRS